MAVVTITLPKLGQIESQYGRRVRDELVIQAVARILRLTRVGDAVIRTSTNELMLFAVVGHAQGGEFLRGKIGEAAPYLVESDEIECSAPVTVTSSDRFSTLDSLLHWSNPSRARKLRDDSGSSDASNADSAAAVDRSDGDDLDDEVDTPDRGIEFPVPLVVYSLPDGHLQAANAAARALFRLDQLGLRHVHASDIANPIDSHNTAAALSALSSGATDSYRAHRTLITADGPLKMLTSVRRLVVGAGAIAVVLTVPAHPDEPADPESDDPFSAALVAGSIDVSGGISSVSSPNSPMEGAIVGTLVGTCAWLPTQTRARSSMTCWPRWFETAMRLPRFASRTPNTVGSCATVTCS